MKKYDLIYLGFRKFVKKKKLIDYDNEYFERKKHTYKFMIPFILKYINIEKLRNKIYHKNDFKILDLFNTYVNRDPKWIDKVISMKATHEINFLFKDN